MRPSNGQDMAAAGPEATPEKYPNNYKRVYPKNTYLNLKTYKNGPVTSTASMYTTSVKNMPNQNQHHPGDPRQAPQVPQNGIGNYRQNLRKNGNFRQNTPVGPHDPWSNQAIGPAVDQNYQTNQNVNNPYGSLANSLNSQRPTNNYNQPMSGQSDSMMYGAVTNSPYDYPQASLQAPGGRIG